MRVLVTGSADGLGRAAALELQKAGHRVVAHVRSRARLSAVADLLEAGAKVVVGDLSDLEQVRGVAEQANEIDRLVYLSSGMHRGGCPRLSGLDWSGSRATGSYSDSKLFVTALTMAVARLWPEVVSNAVDPGWVPTRMGGPNAPDDLRLGCLTQEWLATSNDPEALTSGGYWHHQRRVDPHPSVRDEQFQHQLLDALANFTGTRLS
jgi:NAD(P)-dependent dehydrogenase (short-subunit alcohol dehydrogenase family)